MARGTKGFTDAPIALRYRGGSLVILRRLRFSRRRRPCAWCRYWQKRAYWYYRLINMALLI